MDLHGNAATTTAASTKLAHTNALLVPPIGDANLMKIRSARRQTAVLTGE